MAAAKKRSRADAAKAFAAAVGLDDRLAAFVAREKTSGTRKKDSEPASRKPPEVPQGREAEGRQSAETRRERSRLLKKKAPAFAFSEASRPSTASTKTLASQPNRTVPLIARIKAAMLGRGDPQAPDAPKGRDPRLGKRQKSAFRSEALARRADERARARAQRFRQFGRVS